jgi:hypothetical protein
MRSFGESGKSDNKKRANKQKWNRYSVILKDACRNMLENPNRCAKRITLFTKEGSSRGEDKNE